MVIPCLDQLTVWIKSFLSWLTGDGFRTGPHEAGSMSPDSTSSLFPDRPIRPLPKRRLRERLSPDVADAIKYPPAPKSTTPLFVYPYNAKEDAGVLSGSSSHWRETVVKPGIDGVFRRNVLGIEHEEEPSMGQARRVFSPRGLYDTQGHESRAAQRPGQTRHPKPQPPPSTASSADGYDSFENTNNKKKRKIPTAGEAIANGGHVLNDPAAFGVPSPPMTGDEGSGDVSGASTTPYYQSGGPATNGQQVSGPGRGRFGRIRNGRSPLRTLPDANTSWTGRNLKLRPGGQYPSPPAEKAGIISSAIASAEKLPVPQGQENISLLHQQTLTKSTPASTQFTFSIDSQNPVSWPGSDPAPTHMSGTPRAQQGVAPDYPGSNTRATQTTHGTYASGSDIAAKGAAGANVAPKKHKKRGNSLQRQAKQRQKETQARNMHHPPAPEDMWVCEFCEYERIFGRPPEALIRQYEIKDRRRQKEEAERRRLLEKAKMKSRKGKKANKVPAKNNAAVPDRASTSSHDQQVPPPPPQDAEEYGEEQQSEGLDPDDIYDDNVRRGGQPRVGAVDEDPPPDPPIPVQAVGTAGSSGGAGGVCA
ncbi:hypothetical protein F5Y15DRAFT_225907 [Xylariaceae sp. FL0016]|nr:hypothetical protein F5Y15DRAFT_225907 [Xylariaceae sp. FL0016]